MIRLILVLLFALPVSVAAQSHVYRGFYTQHDQAVANAFIAGYNEHGIWSGTLNVTGESIEAAASSGAAIYVKSYVGYGDHLTEADSTWPEMMVVMPVGYNGFIRSLAADSNMTTMVLVGAGTSSNVTAYDIEFFGPDPYGGNASSFSAGYIAGQLLFIKDSLGCSWWEARYRARVTASSGRYHASNGYGKINVIAAINYAGSVPSDPYPSALPVIIPKVPTRVRQYPVWHKVDSPE